MPKNRDYTGLVRTPPSMAWLIRERARLKGAIDKIDKQLEQLPRERVALVQALASLDQVIPLHEVRVDPEAIVGVKAQAPRIAPYGKLRKGILTALRLAQGRPLYSFEIAGQVAHQLGLHLDGPTKSRLRVAVKKQLQKLRDAGLAKPLHEWSKGKSEDGVWVLTTGQSNDQDDAQRLAA